MDVSYKILSIGHTHDRREVIKVEDEIESFPKNRVNDLVKMFEENMVLNKVKQTRDTSSMRSGEMC